MSNPLELAVRRLCLAFPEAEVFRSHGAPNFRPKGGKIFATYVENHHGDGRLALWLNVPPGVQDAYVRAEPRHYYVPQYVGPAGWLGVRLDQGIAWKTVAELVRLAYDQVAAPRLRALLKRTPVVPAPTRRMSVADVDPQRTPRGQRIMKSMRALCLALPGTSEALQFGKPVWRVGKKVFAQAYCYDKGWRTAFWVGVAAQSFMTNDPRFEIPAYLGHNGWIALDVAKRHVDSELRALALDSYRHFAPQKLVALL